MRPTQKTLRLHKETLRQLSSSHLRHVAGGASWPNICYLTQTCPTETCSCEETGCCRVNPGSTDPRCG
jgi:hypothetical protein